MRAVVYIRGKGVQLQHDRARPRMGPGQVTVDVRAAAINPVDYKMPAWVMHGRGVGLDLAGVIAGSR